MNRITLLAAVIGLVFPIGVVLVHAGTDDPNYIILKKIIEPQIKEEFEKDLSLFREEALKNDPRFLEKNSRDVELVTDEIKSRFYNKAYNLYVCVKTLAADASLSNDERSKRLPGCYLDRNKELAKNFKMMTEYLSLFMSQAGKTEQCMLKSRLFDAEIEFPPFDFLKQSNGRDALYNYPLLNTCLQSIGQ